jgi:electron transfer flavoprotein alpha subunit
VPEATRWIKWAGTVVIIRAEKALAQGILLRICLESSTGICAAEVVAEAMGRHGPSFFTTPPTLGGGGLAKRLGRTWRTKRHAQKRSLKSSHKRIFYTNKTNKKRIAKLEANEPTKNDGNKRREETQGNRQATSNPRRLQHANATAPSKQERQTTTESKQETTLRGAQPPEHEHADTMNPTTH